MSGVDAVVATIGQLVETLASPLSIGVAAIVLGVTLSWSGFVKLTRPLPAAWAMVDFDLISRPNRMMGRALGLIEALVGLGLTLRVGVIALFASALVLTCLFSLLILRSLLRGQRFECACFGSKHELSWTSLVRSLLLAAIAGSGLAGVSLNGVDLNDLLSIAGTLELVSAVAILGFVVLMSQIPNLMRLNLNLPSPSSSAS